MKNSLIIITTSLGLMACGAIMADPYDKDLAPSKPKVYSGAEGQKKQQKDQTTLTKEANKLKCQDAKLDLVDAEAEGDVNRVRQVKARVHKLCTQDK
ncbi:hypothetical protein [Paraglaciecola aestuariivivens]